MKLVIFALALSLGLTAKAVDVTDVSGKCLAEIKKQTAKHIGPNNKDFHFDGFQDIEFEDAKTPNVFLLPYAFNDECQGGVEVTIKATKVLQKAVKPGHKQDNFNDASECTVEKIVDDSADCG